MTNEEADFIGSMNMCDEISNKAYKKIMCNCEVEESQPCEDCISRKTALKVFAEECAGECACCEYNGSGYDTAENCKLIKSLPSVTPKQKTGKWIRWYEILKCDGYEDHLPHWKCSECEQEVSPYSAGFINYCPNCGAKMEVEDENKTK